MLWPSSTARLCALSAKLRDFFEERLWTREAKYCYARLIYSTARCGLPVYQQRICLANLLKPTAGAGMPASTHCWMPASALAVTLALNLENATSRQPCCL